MKTADFLAQNPALEEEALRHYGYEITGNRHIDCPFCDKKKSFRVSYVKKFGRHLGICTCGSFTAIKMISQASNLDTGPLLAEIDSLVGNTSDPMAHKPKPSTRADEAIKKFKSGQPIKGTIAEEYLASRGIYTMPRGGAVFLPREHFYETDGPVYSAIYCLASDAIGRPIYSHTTYLDGPKKADLDGKERKQRGLLDYVHEWQSCSVKLAPKGGVMAVGEGIETCLAFSQIKNIPVHACLNTSLLSKYRADDDITHLYIAADNDHTGAGLAAAWECATANIRQRKNLDRVTICWPRAKGTDFNDALIDSLDILEDYVCKKPK